MARTEIVTITNMCMIYIGKLKPTFFNDEWTYTKPLIPCFIKILTIHGLMQQQYFGT
jgi:hypothetical protein